MTARFVKSHHQLYEALVIQRPVRVSGEKRKKSDWVTGLRDHSLAVAGSKVGIDAHIC